MQGLPSNLRADEGLEVLQENLANDGLDLMELGGEVSECVDTPQFQSKYVTASGDQIQCTFKKDVLN